VFSVITRIFVGMWQKVETVLKRGKEKGEKWRE
jgi:hypothetical protein